MPRRVLLLLVALLLVASPTTAQARPPRPQIAVKLLTRDPVSVLQSGVFSLRITSRGARRLRLTARAQDGAKLVSLGRGQPSRYKRTRRGHTRTLHLAIGAAGRRALSTCYTARIIVT